MKKRTVIEAEELNPELGHTGKGSVKSFSSDCVILFGMTFKQIIPSNFFF